MNSPGLHKSTGVGYNDRSHVHISGVDLVGQCEGGQWFIDGNVHRDVGRTPAVVGINRVGGGRLVGIR